MQQYEISAIVIKIEIPKKKPVIDHKEITAAIESLLRIAVIVIA